MLTTRKLALLAIGLFLIVVFLVKQPSAPSLAQYRPHRTSNTVGALSASGKTKEDIEKLLAESTRPFKSPDEFTSLREHLEYLFPYKGATATKFPAYIWQTWKFTPAMGEFDERFRMTEASWTERHPEYVHEVSHPGG
jgi:alpha 1,6-mannosyltransferase